MLFSNAQVPWFLTSLCLSLLSLNLYQLFRLTHSISLYLSLFIMNISLFISLSIYVELSKSSVYLLHNSILLNSLFNLFYPKHSISSPTLLYFVFLFLDFRFPCKFSLFLRKKTDASARARQVLRSMLPFGLFETGC